MVRIRVFDGELLRVCGIAGITGNLECFDPKAFIDRSLKILNHRGPDDFGLMAWHQQSEAPRFERDSKNLQKNDEVLFVHRRLSILDLNPTGWQPMGLPDGSAVVTYNGEIYNYIELRKELEKRGHVFISHSDTEVLLHAYQEWGISMLECFEGMFAFCLLDTRKKRLYLARDQFGVKPLFYVFKNGIFGFASEPSVLLEIPGISRAANLHAVCEYARFGSTDHGEDTLWEDIYQVLPAHFLTFDLHSKSPLQKSRFWKIDLHQQIDVSFDEASKKVRELFLDSVRLHMRSDVPYGATLSGGIDSSSVVMAMRENLGPHVSFPVFSYISTEASTSEERWIDEVARVAGVKVTKIHPTSEDMRSEIKDLIFSQNEPFGSTSIYAQYKVFEAVQKSNLKVMLDGQGADEMLAGYRPYLGARIASMIRSKEFPKALQLLARSSLLPDSSLKTNILYTLNYLAGKGAKDLFARWIGKETMPPWFNSKWLSARRISLQHRDFTEDDHILRYALYDGLTHSGVPHLLRYADRNSMRFSVESRVPFLNVKLAEYLFSLPEEYLIDQKGVSKAVFRAAMRGLVPDLILDRKDKIGFATPEGQWLRQSHEWVDSILCSPSLSEQLPFLDAKKVSFDWKNFLETGKGFDWRFWRWINLAEWARSYQVCFS